MIALEDEERTRQMRVERDASTRTSTLMPPPMSDEQTTCADGFQLMVAHEGIQGFVGAGQRFMTAFSIKQSRCACPGAGFAHHGDLCFAVLEHGFLS